MAVLAAVAALALGACEGDPPAQEEPPATTGDVERVPGQVVDADSVALSPDGRTLAAPCLDDLCLWDTADGSLRATYDGGPVVAWSPDGELLATTRTEENRPLVVLLDAADGTEVRTLAGHGEVAPSDAAEPGITTLAFGSDEVLASAGSDGTVRLWSADDGADLATLETASGAPDQLAFSPDGETLAVAGPDEPVELWDVAGAERRAALAAPPQETVAYDPDGATLATATSAADEDATVTLWDAAGQQVRSYPGPVLAYRLAFSPDGRTLAMTQKDDPDVLLWPVAGDGTPRRLSGLAEVPRSVLWAPDGRTLWTVGGEEGVVAWDPRTGREVRRFELPAEAGATPGG